MKFVAFIDIPGDKPQTEERLRELIEEAIVQKRSEFFTWPYGAYSVHVHVECRSKRWPASNRLSTDNDDY